MRWADHKRVAEHRATDLVSRGAHTLSVGWGPLPDCRTTSILAAGGLDASAARLGVWAVRDGERRDSSILAGCWSGVWGG
jgi:hypothetical protein